MKKNKQRIDKILVDRDFAKSRARAEALIMSGNVIITLDDGKTEKRVDKPSELFNPSVNIRLKEKDFSYVSRGGLKIEGACKDFQIDVKGKNILDIGASTGGFTDYCLKNGAKLVVCVDVGTNQLDWKIRTHPQVKAFEQTDIRNFRMSEFFEMMDLITIDASFISLKKILNSALLFLHKQGNILALIKPQFEAERENIKKGGIVKNPKIQQDIVDQIKKYSQDIGLFSIGVFPSHITGTDGNQEFFILLSKK